MTGYCATVLITALTLLAAAPARAVEPFAVEAIAITDTAGAAIAEASPGQTVRVTVSYRLDRPGLVLLCGEMSGAGWTVRLGYRVHLRLSGRYAASWTQAIPLPADGPARVDVTQYVPLLYERVLQSAFFTVAPSGVSYVGSARCRACHAESYAAWEQTRHNPYTGCESCHGPGGDHVGAPSAATIVVDRTAQVCRPCHSRNDGTVIEADSGLIKPQQQYNEWASTAHGRFLQCATCHDPHYSVSHAPLRAIRAQCVYCHPLKRVHLGMAVLPCTSCHMPPAVNAGGATGLGPYRRGDTASHIWRIKTENPPGTMYVGDAVVGDIRGPYLTLDIACMSCHDGDGARLYDFESVRQTATIVH